MNRYKFILKPKSFFSTIFSSDTIFGIICWYVRHLEGEDALVAMLRDFEKEPPFLITSLLPNGYLPRPLLPFSMKDDVDEINRNKKMKKVKWIPVEVFANHQKQYQQDSLLKEDICQKDELLKEKIIPVEITRNSIDRISGTVREGVLFTDTYEVVGDDIEFVVYVTEITPKYSEILANAFELACQMGLGREASVGKGFFDLRKENLNEREKKIFEEKGSHFISLSLCAGKNLHPVSYSTFTRYGKLGGEFSQRGINGALLFNKKPIVFYKEGSVFKANDDFAGTMLTNVHVDARIVQYAYAFPVYFTPNEIVDQV